MPNCAFYGGPHDGAVHAIGSPLPPEVLMPDMVPRNLHAMATPAEAFAVAGPDVQRLPYWLARHALTGAPVYVLADMVKRTTDR